jgi:acetyl-CoA carboxylase carboxyl transferase subunit alpha
MGITAERLRQLKLIDAIIEEPVGGAHRDYAQIAARVGTALQDALDKLTGVDPDALVQQRHARLNQFGEFTEK